MFSKIGKFRRGSQGNHPTALNFYKGNGILYFAALIFLFRFFIKKKMKVLIKKIRFSKV